MSNSRDLINAAINGNLEDVRSALKKFCDINSVIEEKNIKVTAFLVSVNFKHWHVAKYLILSGIKLECENIIHYEMVNMSLYAYPWAVIQEGFDEECFSIILRHVKNLNPNISFVGDDAVKVIPVVSWLSMNNNAEAKLKLCYILSDAMITSNTNVIAGFAKIFEEINFSIAIFQKHLNKYEELTPRAVI